MRKPQRTRRCLCSGEEIAFRLDPALVRPGRMDLHVEFKPASAFQARELYNYKRFYLPSAIRKDDTTSASEKAPKTDEADIHEGGSGFSGLPERKDNDLPASSSQSDSSGTNFSVKGAHHTRMPVLSVAQVERLATRLSEVIPEREFSMASLQRYLMNYKTQPSLRRGAWVQQKREESERKDRVEKARAARKAARKAK